MATISGYRGSSSNQASAYKKQGHDDEQIFSHLIGGTVKKGEHTGKTGVIGPDGLTYSVKGGQKKWQIFLYAYERIKSDQDFHKIAMLGQSLIGSLESFPKGYDDYARDKDSCLAIIAEHSRRNKLVKAAKDLDLLKSLISEDNYYFSAKLKLLQSNKKLCDLLQDKDHLKFFLDKAIFNLEEVDRIAIKNGPEFIIFDKSDALNILTQGLTVKLSASGNRKSDLNVDGQKIIMCHTGNVAELEVRNDSDKHFRQLRFNMIKAKALALLLEKSTVVGTPYPFVILRQHTQAP